MELKPTDIENIAHLARLSINQDDIADYQRKLSSILTLAQQLDGAKTDGISPLVNPLGTAQRVREDKVTEVDQHTWLQSIAPVTEAGLYLVPKVIGSE